MKLILALILPAIIVGLAIWLDSLDRRANKMRDEVLREYLHREELKREEETIPWTVPKEPTCKCAYCECTNDHIYGTCDYCGAPLSGGDSG